MLDHLKQPSSPEQSFPVVERAKAEEPAEFKSKHHYTLPYNDRDYSKQFNSMYYQRLNALRNRISAKCRRKWQHQTVNDMAVTHVEKILDIEAGQPSWIIGTIFSQLKYKLNVLKEVAENTYGAPPPPPEAYSDPENDQIMIEDESGRVFLAGKLLDTTILVSGDVVGLLGAEVQPGVFEAVDICYPEAAPQLPRAVPKADGSTKIAFVSGLGISPSGGPDPKLELLKDFLVGDFLPEYAQPVARLFIAGNSILVHDSTGVADAAVAEKDKYKALNRSNFDADAIRQLDAFLKEIMLSVPVTIMPGESDPAESTFPQAPLPKSFFAGNRHLLDTTHFNRATNPAWFEVDGARILGTSGENVTDIYKYILPLDKVKKAGHSEHQELEEPGEIVTLCPEDSRMPILQSTLNCQHIVPTAPDTLWCYPFKDEDPFILNETPHVYFVGNQPKFEYKVVPVEDLSVHAFTIPRFDLTGEVVLMDTATLECEVIRLSIDTD